MAATPLFPTQVPIDEAAVKRLTDRYKKAYQSMIDEMAGASDFTVSTRKALMASIEKQLTDLGVDTQKWLEEELPKQYRTGTGTAFKQLKAIGAKTGAGLSFTSIDGRAVQALISDASLSFGESLSAVNRSANKIFNDAFQLQTRELIAEGVLTGQTRKMISDSVSATLQQKGLTGLVDKRGREWSLPEYTEMLVRTKLTESRNTGLANKMIENGQDLVEVSYHGAGDVCGRWEGVILSLTGKTPGYKTLDEAMASGLFHPRCRHAINAINMRLAMKTQAYNSQTGEYEKGYRQPADRKAVIKNNVGTKSPNVVMMGDTKKPTIFTLSDTEMKFVADVKLKIEMAAPGKLKADTLGAYSPKTNTLMMKNVTQDSVQQTFFHELGHAIDHRLNPKRGVRMISREDIKSALLAEREGITYTRLIRNDMSPAMATAFSKGEAYRGKMLPSKFRNYMNSPSELWADAYGQFRTNPDNFRVYAPKLYKIFMEVM